MSIALVVTRGYGNGTLTGTIPFVTTRGYSIGEVIISPTNRIMVPTVQARTMLIAAVGRTVTPTVIKRTMTPKVR